MPNAWALALVLGATVVAYLPAIDGEFLFDDVQITRDALVVDPFGHAASEWLATGRPAAVLTFALDYAVVGFKTRGWHVTNLAIHLGAIVLAWAFTRVTLARAKFSHPDGIALATAALFALHPLQTESVAYLTQREESLASAVYLAALLLLLARDETQVPRHRFALLAGAIALDTIGLAVKPIVATLPFVWLLHSALLPAPSESQLTGLQRASRRAPAALPLIALSTIAGILAVRGTAGALHAGLSVPRLPPTLYLATQLRVIPTYLRLLVWPVGQCADWDFPPSESLFEPAVLGGALFVGGIICAAIVVWSHLGRLAGDARALARTVIFGALTFFLVLAPSSSILPLIDPLAERRVYLASLGLFIAAATAATLAIRSVAGSRARRVGVALAFTAIVAAGVATARRSAVWTTPVAFWADAAEKAPQKARVHLNLGTALFDAGRHQEALASFETARDRMGDHTISSEVLLVDIVGALLALDRADQAREEVTRTLARTPRDPVALAQLARLDFVADRLDDSERAALAALETDRRNATALKFLGLVRATRGDVAGARQALRDAAATQLADPATFLYLGDLEERSGELAAACNAYAHAAAQPGAPWASASATASRARLRCR